MAAFLVLINGGQDILDSVRKLGEFVDLSGKRDTSLATSSVASTTVSFLKPLRESDMR